MGSNYTSANPLAPTEPGSRYRAYADPTDFINRLPAYDQSAQTDVLLDLLREIIYSGNYYWVGASFPYGSLVNVPADATVTGSVALPPGTYITSITHFNDPTVNPEGFKLLMYDKGTKAPIAYGGYIKNNIISSDMVVQNIADPEPTGSGIFGPAYLTSPFIVTPPGVINWEIVNFSSNAAIIQVMLSTAVPVRFDTLSGVRRVMVQP